jgi:alanine-glyoxylate transaminase/serine-glyoxylate transaminase/serine-pyruvate transaminase
MDDVQGSLRQVFGTQSPITLPISGTGTAGMETAMVNMIEPGDPVLICTAGYFANRMAEIAERAGGQVHRLEAPWGRVFEADQVKAAVERIRPRVVAFVHVETSTGTSQPIEPLAEVLNRDDIITIMDCVASLAGEPIDVAGNGLDFVYSGSQKCLSCPPGLAPITLSQKAIDRLSNRKTPVQSWYLDLAMLRRYWSDVRVYHHTAPISLNYALREALRIIEEEGLPNLYARHRLNHEALVAGIEALGLRMFVDRAARAWTLNTVCIPDDIDDQTVRTALLERHGIEIVGGLGDLKGKVWRIGLMGYSSNRNNILLLLAALEEILGELGYEGGGRGEGVSAASAVYRGAPGVPASPTRNLTDGNPVRVG